MAKKERPVQQAEKISRETADELGYELLETSFDREPAGVYLRIYLDKQGGVSLSDCERFHRAVQPRLEQVDYDFLEVCSPGIDRPIKDEKDAVKAKGARVEVRLFSPFEGSREHAGILLGLDGEGFRIMTGSGEKVFPRKDVALVRREVDLSALESPGATEQEDDI